MTAHHHYHHYRSLFKRGALAWKKNCITRRIKGRAIKPCSVLILSAVLLLCIPMESLAGINQEINRQTPFNNFTDSLATLGKSPKQKTAIKNERRLKRSQARLKKIRESHLKRSAQQR